MMMGTAERARISRPTAKIVAVGQLQIERDKIERAGGQAFYRLCARAGLADAKAFALEAAEAGPWHRPRRSQGEAATA
jgi:hypothetical protein